MSCCGEREKLANIKNEQRWDYINLDDFQANSCGTGLSYGFLWFLLFVSIGVYAVDLFTAANLLFFDRWSGQVQPAIPFRISRWIFAGCIILSLVLLVYRWWRALRVIKSDSITKSYLDPLAVRIQSIRMGKEGRGWRRFLVFAALTRGRKGAEYVALFTYFTFEAWLRIVFAEGPRQVINALTLYSVLNAKLIPVGEHAPSDGHSPVAQFFVNVSILAGHDREQAVILFGMLYTLIIWVFSALSLILALIFYILFLWHHIPSNDGTLSKYCKRKIEKRLHNIVMETVNTALAKEDKKRALNDLARPGLMGTATSDVKRQPTLPLLDTQGATGAAPALSRQTTQTDLTPFQPRPSLSASTSNEIGSPLHKTPTIPDLSGTSARPVLPSRQTTQSSANSISSYASDAPLMSGAGAMGYGGQDRSRSESRNRPMRMESNTTIHSQRPPTGRSYSGQSHQGRPPPRRQNTDMSGTSAAPAFNSRSQSRQQMSRDPSTNQISPRSMQTPPPPQRGQAQEYEMYPPRSASAMSSRPTTAPGPGPQGAAPYRPYKPGPAQPPVRNFTAPYRPYLESRSDVPERSGTAPIPQSYGHHDSVIDSYGAQAPAAQMPPRPSTAGPGVRPYRPPAAW